MAGSLGGEILAAAHALQPVVTPRTELGDMREAHAQRATRDPALTGWSDGQRLSGRMPVERGRAPATERGGLIDRSRAARYLPAPT